MSTSLRLSEKWFQRGLWVVAIIFASFLIGLGGKVIGDLPRVEARRTFEDFIDKPAAEKLRAQIEASQKGAAAALAAQDQAKLKLQAAQAQYSAAQSELRNWQATRSVTQRAEDNPEVLKRTQALEVQSVAVRDARTEFDRLAKVVLDAQQEVARAREPLVKLEVAAQERLQAELKASELRVFGYRLALTLPLILVAGWLFKNHRKSANWPFVWGFIFFALFAFFVELVPYLPSFGGYVRYIVGLAVTAVAGRQAIISLQAYLERQRQAEQMPDLKRRETLSYDTALDRIGKGICPGCERPVDIRNEAVDYCPHCGIGLFNRCGHCQARKNAFTRFCHACGTAAAAARTEQT